MPPCPRRHQLPRGKKVLGRLHGSSIRKPALAVQLPLPAASSLDPPCPRLPAHLYSREV